jgi:hypothetical protein
MYRPNDPSFEVDAAVILAEGPRGEVNDKVIEVIEQFVAEGKDVCEDIMLARWTVRTDPSALQGGVLFIVEPLKRECFVCEKEFTPTRLDEFYCANE